MLKSTLLFSFPLHLIYVTFFNCSVVYLHIYVEFVQCLLTLHIKFALGKTN